MTKNDRRAIYRCIYELRYDMDCIGNEEYTPENVEIWLEDMTDRELSDILFGLVGEML